MPCPRCDGRLMHVKETDRRMMKACLDCGAGFTTYRTVSPFWRIICCLPKDDGKYLS